MDNDNDFQVTLRDANSHKSGWFEGVHNCRLGENNFLRSQSFVFIDYSFFKEIFQCS